MSPKYIIPNLLTSLNLFSGAIAITTAFQGYENIPVYFLLCAALFDFLDGFTAKLLHATSEFGKQLDSLADLISFGMAPAVLLYLMLEASLPIDISPKYKYIIQYSSFIFVVFAALRLARFNIRDTVHSDFLGLPVPAATLFIVSIWIFSIDNNGNQFIDKLVNPVVLVILNLTISLLMISRQKMLSLKFAGYGLRGNLWRYLLLGGSIGIIVLFQKKALFGVMVFYLFLSVIRPLITRKTD
jgi:CDP-diacylglycerol--serine O-phosphatidyltransferase